MFFCVSAVEGRARCCVRTCAGAMSALHAANRSDLKENASAWFCKSFGNAAGSVDGSRLLDGMWTSSNES